MQFSTPETRASLILRLPDVADMAAWDRFESLYAPVIQRVALRQGLQPADVDNVVQEVLLRVAKSVGKWLTVGAWTVSSLAADDCSQRNFAVAIAPSHAAVGHR